MSLILHLSDLHLGTASAADVPDDYKSEIIPLEERTTRFTMLKETLTQLSEILARDNTRLDALVVSGDITFANNEEGFRRFEDVLSWLGDSRPDPHKIVVVPGNHDVTEGSLNSTEHYKYFIPYIRDKGYVTPLLEGIDFDGNGKAVGDLAKHFLLDVAGRWGIIPINSSHYCGSFEPLHVIPEKVWTDLPKSLSSADPSLKEPELRAELRRVRLRDVARVSREQLNGIRAVRAVIDEKMRELGTQPLIIGVIHHQLLPVSVREEFKPFETITNLGHLRYVLRDNQFSIVLHGHKHADYVYFDYIHSTPDAEIDSPHRVLVISAPHLKTAGPRPEGLARLINIDDEPLAAVVSLTDVPAAEHGILLQLPPKKFFHLEQPVKALSINSARVHLVEGTSLDEVYEKALARFKGSPLAALLSNFVCRIAQTDHPVLLPKSYPQIENVHEEERPLWFTKIVAWWQKKDFDRLSADHHFNHGDRIYRYAKGINQVESVVQAIKEDPLTSRGVMTLLKPHFDDIKQDSKFPSFCFVQFLVRELSDRSLLDIVAHFRKQEIRYWWPVNVSELSQLQHEVFDFVKGTVSEKLRRPLELGSITTIAAMAHIGDKAPVILVQPVDFDLEESPHKLWDMIYAIYWPEMPDREKQIETWKRVLAGLEPPEQQDSSGVPVAVQGIQYLAEISEHFGRNHGEITVNLAKLWRDLESTNRFHESLMEERKLGQTEHLAWRGRVLQKLGEIRHLVGGAFGIADNQL